MDARAPMSPPPVIDYASAPVRRATPKWMRVVGWILTGVIGLMFIAGPIVTFFVGHEAARKGFAEQGYPDSAFKAILMVELICGLLFVIPRTAMLGAILLVGFFGGAVATHVRAGDGLWFVPVIFGVVVGLAMWLRDARVRALVPLRRTA
jgi:uncharacterized sodium:solute symporter family permease YidK